MILRALLILSFAATASAWTMTGSRVSGFGGTVLLTPPTQESSKNNMLTMKKGKANVPSQMRSQYAKQQEMASMRQQMISASKPGEDGFPVFNLFVRTKRANMWYPCGSFKGDERSAALAKSYSEDGLLAGISKKQLDGGIAGSLAQDENKLKETICRAYPQLRKSRDEFEYGYKLAYTGLPEDKAKEIFPVVPKKQEGVFDGIKNIFS